MQSPIGIASITVLPAANVIPSVSAKATTIVAIRSVRIVVAMPGRSAADEYSGPMWRIAES